MMRDDIGVRLTTARRPRRARRAASVGLLLLATVMGVRLGLGGPAVSPVSPAAIAARYGVAGTAIPPAAPVVGQVMSQGHRRVQRDGRHRE